MRPKTIRVSSRIRIKGLQGEKISGLVQSFSRNALIVKTKSGAIVIIPWKLLGGYWKPK